MISRDDLKCRIDRVPEDRLEASGTCSISRSIPPTPNPEIQRMHERTRESRKRVEQRFRETRKSGTISGLGGGGKWGVHNGVPFGRIGFNYWDENALVHQTLQSFDGHELEIMERVSLSGDRSKLLCTTELCSGGVTVQHSDEFPIPRRVEVVANSYQNRPGR
jgi:hypothetical protein